MSEFADNLDGIDDIKSCYVVTREDPNFPISTREFRSSLRTWVKEIEHAKIYVDVDLASNVRRLVAKNTENFLQKNGYAIPTRFAHPKLGDVVDQLFKGDKDIISLTQGLSSSKHQVRRDYRDYKRVGGND